MPFSHSSRFAQSLSFIRALLPHTLCARTCVHTHTHVLGIGVYTCHLSHGKLRRKPQHPTLDGFLAVSHPCNSCSRFLYKLGDTRLPGGSGGLRWTIDRDSYNLFSEIYVLVIHLGKTKSHLLSYCKLSMKRRGLSTLNIFLME